MDKMVVILIGAGVCCIVIGFGLFLKLLTTKNSNENSNEQDNISNDEYIENFKECFRNTGNIEETLEQLADIYMSDQYIYNLIMRSLDYIRDEQGDYETALEMINVENSIEIMKLHNAAIKKALNISSGNAVKKTSKPENKKLEMVKEIIEPEEIEDDFDNDDSDIIEEDDIEEIEDEFDDFDNDDEIEEDDDEAEEDDFEEEIIEEIRPKKVNKKPSRPEKRVQTQRQNKKYENLDEDEYDNNDDDDDDDDLSGFKIG